MQILIPDSWLREYLQTEATPKDIQNSLSLCGPSVERLHQHDNDSVYDIEVTTNRPDMMSVYGIAREAVAILPKFNFKSKLLDNPLATKTQAKLHQEVDYLSVKVDSNLCYRFTAVLVKNVSASQSPDWLQKKLNLVGIRPINVVVDISNLLMHELGQPVHTFDYDKINNSRMILRNSKPGETITTLDNKIHTLSGNDIVIEDGSGELIDLCGIMGGLNSSVDENTKNVLLFVQTYEPIHIRKTSMGLAARSNAAVLFEKGLSTSSVLPTLERGIRYLSDLAGGTAVSDILDIYPTPELEKTITLKESLSTFASNRLGVNCTPKECKEILSSLGFVCHSDSKFTIPWWRTQDITIPEDLVEEVARIHGYHNLPSILMSGQLPTQRANDTEFRWIKKIRDTLFNWGYTETYSYSLVANDTGLKLKNPLSSEWVYLRTSLLSSHKQIISDNFGRTPELNLFEISNVYIPKNNNLPDERLHLIVSTTNKNYSKLKGAVQTLITDILGIDISAVSDLQSYSDHRSHFIEMDLTSLIPQAKSIKNFIPISQFESITEDFNFKRPTNWNHFKNKIRSLSPLITEPIKLVEEYNDKITVRIHFHSTKKQLSKDSIADIRKKLESFYCDA